MRRTCALPLIFLASLALGQGTRADYERSDRLPELLQGKVFRSSVVPHWLDGGKSFWYSVETGPGTREYDTVDAGTGAKQLAFDPGRLAKALAAKLGSKVASENLSVGILKVEPGTLVIGYQGKRYRLDRRTYRVEELQGKIEGVEAGSLPAFLPPHASGSGEETWLTLTNASKETVDIYWVDTSGQRTKYYTLTPGQSRQQHTFANHVWLFTDTQGKNLAAYQAVEGDCEAVYDGTPVISAPRRRPTNISPDGKWRAFVRDDNLWVRSESGGAETQLSTDGNAGDAYENRIEWSPDSSHVMAVRVEAGQEHKVYIVKSSPEDQLQPKLLTLDYLKPGDKIPHPRLVMFDIAAKKEVAADADLTPNPWDLTEFHWSPDSKELYFVYNQRGHQVLRLLAADATTGKVRTIVEEKSPTFIDYQAKLWVRYLDKTNEALWMSERSGYNHIYLVDMKAATIKPVTQGNWMVRSVESVDEGKRQMLLRIMGRDPKQDPYYFHYCRVNFDGTGFTMLTDGDGTHRLVWSPDGQTYLDTYSRVDMPPVTELRRTSDGTKLATLEKGDDSALLKTGWTPPERFVAKGRDGKTDIYGIIEKPTDFDPHKKYPVIESIYAGPQDFFVPKAFAPFRSPQKVAELGFIVVQIDGMGTDWRGKAFHDVCYQNLADAGFPDRILWMKAAAKTRPWMDLSRVGVYGTSAGGQSAASAVMRFGDFYKAAVADCGCHDNRMDKIWWNELWMGWPIGPSYAANSNVTAAKDLKGKLYLMVGEDDTNVDPASTMQVVNALIQANKDFDLLVYPNSNHGVLGHPYAFRRMEDFFVRWAFGAEPRR